MHQNLSKMKSTGISSWATPRADMHPLPLSTRLTHTPMARMDTVIKVVMLNVCKVIYTVGNVESPYFSDTSMIRFNLYHHALGLFSMRFRITVVLSTRIVILMDLIL